MDYTCLTRIQIKNLNQNKRGSIEPLFFLIYLPIQQVGCGKSLIYRIKTNRIIYNLNLKFVVGWAYSPTIN